MYIDTFIIMCTMYINNMYIGTTRVILRTNNNINIDRSNKFKRLCTRAGRRGEVIRARKSSAVAALKTTPYRKKKYIF